MRNEFKAIEISIEYTNTKRNCQADIKQKAEVEFGVNTVFASIERFMDDFNKVLSAYKHCAESNTYCKVYLSVAAYDQAGNYQTTRQNSFRGWFFEGTPNADDEGLYLSPDIKYTEESHDIYIAFDKSLLNQLAQANI